MRPRLDAGLKAKIALEVLRNEVTVAELVAKIGAAGDPVKAWKKAAAGSRRGHSPAAPIRRRAARLNSQVLSRARSATVQRFLARLRTISRTESVAMVDRGAGCRYRYCAL
jgi:hypothetical protein